MRTIRLVPALVAAALLLPAASAHATTTLSSNWAGYVVTPHTTATKLETVSGSWGVPQGDCSSGRSGYSAVWVGIGGYRNGSRTLEQTGTEFDCSRGIAKYSAWYELVPDVGHDIRMSVRPGDTIDAAVTVAGSHATLYLRNRTRGVTFRRTFTVKAPDSSSAEWIVEAPSACGTSAQCEQLPISNFGTVSFMHASATTANGSRGSVTLPHASVTEVALSQGGGGRFARFPAARGAEPSALSADGASFSVTYTEQAPPADGEPPARFPGGGEL